MKGGTEILFSSVKNFSFSLVFMVPHYFIRKVANPLLIRPMSATIAIFVFFLLSSFFIAVIIFYLIVFYFIHNGDRGNQLVDILYISINC